MTRTLTDRSLVPLQIVVSAASLVVEIVAGRMLAPYVGMSLTTWTAIIAVVLAGFSAGHWWGGRIAGRDTGAALRLTGWALLWAALSTAVAGWLLVLVAEPVLGAVTQLGAGITLLTLLVFFLPSFFAGVPAPVLAQVAVRLRDDSGGALGAMFAAGALGAIAGTLLAGFVFVPWLGTTLTLAVVTLVYAASGLGMILMAGGGRVLVPMLAAGLALALAGAALAAPAPCTRESRYFCIRSIDISADPERPVRLMVLDHLAHGISARDLPRVMFTDHAAMLDGISRMRAARPDFTSFFIGGGSYSVPRAFHDRGTGEITVAEIDPAVTEMAARDFWFDPDTATILTEDARRALKRRPDRRYDIIVGDAFTDIAVPAHLITREFFALVRSRLTPGGSFVMTVIDFENRLQALGAITATLRAEFDAVEVWTEARQPEPGERLVFVVMASDAPSPVDTLDLNTPGLKTFAPLSDNWTDSLVADHGLILTDDFAPIDRLMGPGR